MSMLDRIRDGFKYLDKNGLKHLIDLIKSHDVHWTGTHAEYEAQKDSIPDYAILHFTDDYDENVQVGVYSTEETKTGELFLNKPVYRKCIVFTTAFPSVSIPNIKDLIATSGFISTTGNSPYNELPFPWLRLHDATTEEAKCYLKSGTDISWVVQNLGLSSTKESVVILEYTKTTD